MNNEMIEKLKKNEKPFGLLSLEEQECLKKVSIWNCLLYTGVNFFQPAGTTFNPETTYCINPDYQPEPEPDPEFVDLEIVRDYQDFNKFWFTDDLDLTGKECKVLYSDVSNARDQDNKVFARLRT